MNQTPIDPPSKKRSFAWRIIICLVVLVFLIAGLSGLALLCFADWRVKRTEIVIQTIRVGLLLEEADRGAMPSLTFDSLRETFGRSSALADLKSLKAIDDHRKCFVDAWGHTLSITVGEHDFIEVISPGQDGVLGTRDDIR